MQGSPYRPFLCSSDIHQLPFHPSPLSSPSLSLSPPSFTHHLSATRAYRYHILLITRAFSALLSVWTWSKGVAQRAQFFMVRQPVATQRLKAVETRNSMLNQFEFRVNVAIFEVKKKAKNSVFFHRHRTQNSFDIFNCQARLINQGYPMISRIVDCLLLVVPLIKSLLI